MYKYVNTVVDFLSRLLFPEREQERAVRLFDITTISTLPRPHEQLDHIHSLFSYKDKRVQALIWELKYHRNNTAIAHIATMLTEEILAELTDRALFENWTTCLLVAVPLTHKRLRDRGFSQIDLLCREIIRQLPQSPNTVITYTPNALTKIRDTKPQSHTHSRAERLTNLRGAFSADDSVVRGQRVILIDDVTTTGTTLNEVRQTLIRAGAKDILSFTIAH